MKKNRWQFWLHSLALFTALQVSPALADDEAPQQDFTAMGSLTWVNDYLFRGISQTWGKPALQFWGEISHRSGVYAGLFASNVSDQMFPDANVELDVLAGHRGTLPGRLEAVSYDVGLTYIYYPGGNYDKARFPVRYESSRYNTLEAAVSLSYKGFGIKTGRTLTEFFGWNTNNSGLDGGFYGDADAGVTGDTQGSWYVETSAVREIAPGWSASALLGYQNIRHAQGLDWMYARVGITRMFAESWSANVSWSGTNERDAYNDFYGLRNTGSTYDVAQPRWLFSLSRNF